MGPICSIPKTKAFGFVNVNAINVSQGVSEMEKSLISMISIEYEEAFKVNFKSS